MAEIIYLYKGDKIDSTNKEPRWLGVDDLKLFNEHLVLCGQRPLGFEMWNKVYTEGTMYCLMLEADLPVARACVEKYSDDKWEVADVRVAKEYRNRGLAYEVSIFVLNYILENGKQPTIRTEEHNIPMQHVISKIGFEILE